MMLKKTLSFLKRNLYIYTIVLSFLLPDLLLRMQSQAFRNDLVTGIPTTFTLLWISFFVLTFTGFMSRKWGRSMYLGLCGFFAVFAVCSYVYFRIFNQFFWLDNVGMTGQAMDYTGFILGYLDYKLLLFIAAEVLLMVYSFRLWRPVPFKTSGLWLIVPILGLVTLHTFMMTETKDDQAQSRAAFVQMKETYRAFHDTNRSMQLGGIYQYVFRNGVRMIFPEAELDASSLSIAETYFSEKQTADNAMTGLFEGKNVIMVMMESVDDWMIDDTYTPTIRYMMENGLNFENHFSCTFGTGYTFNTEFAANTGYHALPAGTPAAALSQNAYPYSLASKFREKGYLARSFHFNSPDFYNRGEMHKAFGYSDYISFLDFMPEKEAQQDAAAIQNPALYREMVPHMDAPFFDFVITYSAHLPYSYADEKLKSIRAKYPSLINVRMDTEINNAQLLAHDTDEFFRILLENLEQDGLLEDTVIVAFSDHFSYGLSSWEKLYALGDATNSDMLEKTPFFIYCAGMEGATVPKVTNSLDILPTISNLFGLSKTPYALGEDAFDPAYPGYAYFSNGAWYDGTIYYFADKQLAPYPDAMRTYIDEMNRKFYIREKVNDIVLRFDYFGEKHKTPLAEESYFEKEGSYGGF